MSFRNIIQRTSYTARMINKPLGYNNIKPLTQFNQGLLFKLHQRNYYAWLFGYDEIDDSLKRVPRSFWIRLAQKLTTGATYVGLACLCVAVADSDWARL
mmetsp:Transcript_34711/g.42805  ORF Transcript_34711/g.42805 Transcript_34711/m.42805 type:complete len:99 (+) Transcript_34711:88-384(+)